jgi:mRNA-degrading endonuclease toxin of MazEF toxin-antitoxin module
VLSTVVCALITSTFHDHVAEVEVSDEEGLDHTCAINCDNLFTLPKSVLARQRGHLGLAKQVQLDRALTIALGLA